MIKAIITDVDGVLVGDKKGINFPLPNEKVIKKLQKLHQRGISVILCSGKSMPSMEKIVIDARLDNPHISDAGAFIYNPLRNQVIQEYVLPHKLVIKIIKACFEKDIYVEVLTPRNYFIQKNQMQPFVKKRVAFLQQEPIVVDSLDDIISQLKVIKILPFVPYESHKEQLESLLKPFINEIHAFWSTAPSLLPAITKVITMKGVSKYHAAAETLKYLGISFDDCLGVGDLPPDWLFIKHCRYGGVVGSADKEFTEQVMSKGNGNYFLGSSVDEDGFLQILDYFKL